MQIVAGVDGGGTRTRVALADTTGKVLGVGISGPSNYGSVPLKKVQDHIGEALQGALDQTGLTDSRIDTIFLGMAGVVSEADQATIRQVVENVPFIQSKQIAVDHDIRISLAGGLAGQEGVALIVGTGSSCYGRRGDGRDWMAGGWGHLLDDKGSAYDLVRLALIAVVRAKDGRAQATSLTDSMLKGLQIDDVTDLMRRLYFEGFAGKGNPMSKEQIASLAPLVVMAAEHEDEVAIRIINKGIKELILMVKVVAENLEFSDRITPVVVTGGMVQQSDYIKDKLYMGIRNTIYGSQIYTPRLSPVLGGVLLALQMAGTGIDSTLIARLENTLSKHNGCTRD